MKSKLTVTEAETLAAMLNSASYHMASVHARNLDLLAPGADSHAWPGRTAFDAAAEMFAGFYAIAPMGVYI